MSAATTLLAAFADDGVIEVGLDEAGRGPLFGPVTVGAVIWNPLVQDPRISLIKDSKKMTKNWEHRDKLEKFIKDSAIAYATASRCNRYIDQHGINNAINSALIECLDRLYPRTKFGRVLMDGNYFAGYTTPTYCDSPQICIPHQCIVGGDNRYISIAAASILAKLEHDRQILQLVRDNPASLEPYGIATNMGYGSAKHLIAIGKYGLTQWHRHSYKIKSLLK
jgi:ribonuclease HII